MIGIEDELKGLRAVQVPDAVRFLVDLCDTWKRANWMIALLMSMLDEDQDPFGRRLGDFRVAASFNWKTGEEEFEIAEVGEWTMTVPKAHAEALFAGTTVQLHEEG